MIEGLRILGSALAAFLVLAAGACGARPARVDVGVVFGNNWVLGPVTLTDAEQGRIKETTLASLREAFRGFDVDFAEDATRDRLIRLNRYLFGSGSTQIGSKVSVVNFDSVNLTLLTVTGCRTIDSCERFTRAQLVEVLGRGIGATAAHELGHQAGFEFVRDAKCDDCYDGGSAKHAAHFFGPKRWSPDALAAMRRVFSATPAHATR